MTWKPACLETGRCCPVRLCGLVACCVRCVHKGQRGKSYAERGGTNDLSSHTAVVTHGSSDGGCGWLDAILTTPPPARGCEERCRDRVQAQPPPWRQRPQKRRTKIRQASEPVRHQRLTHPVTCMQRCSPHALGMQLRDGSATRFMSFACRRRAFSDPAERDDSRHVGTPRC